MLEPIISQIEYATTHLSWHALFGFGLACTVGGLIIWLSGLGMARIAAAVIGGFTGCIIVYVFISVSTLFLLIGALIGVVLGFAFESAMFAFVGYATFAYNLTLSLLTAVGGTLLVFLGMVFLLCLKSARPIEHIESHQMLYFAAMPAMAAFGTVEQFIFCRHKTKVTFKPKTKAPKVDITPSEKTSWRNK